jgi:predicted HAD superfamily Cof-like phosphohydrolase
MSSTKPNRIGMTLLDQAEEFRVAYNLTTNGNQRQTQKALIDEEWSEFHEAFYFEDECDQLKELADLVYVCFQMAASQDWDLDEAMRRVHRSNMSKLGEDGKPIYRGDGKVLKGPNYAPPNLKDLTDK